MSHTKILIVCGVILAASAGFFAGSCAFKGPCHFGGPKPEMQQMNGPDDRCDRRHGQMPGMLSKEQLDSALNLSKDQMAQMDAHKATADSASKAIRKQIKAAEIKLHDILGADNISETDLQAVRTELISLNQQRLDKRIADIRFFRSVLTADQKKKMEEIHKQFLEQMKANKLQKNNSEVEPDEDGPEGPQPGDAPEQNQGPRGDNVQGGHGPQGHNHGHHGHQGGPDDGQGPHNGQMPPPPPRD